ncbi:hypothetical protein B0H65DRAFT_437087 [Neurospora tetraspora]|uniref:Transcription factor Iwr1 domain-containing protein n=1 Tax=Neurospora tetraspora TaxID=94610 RepID=A0AAE0MIY3_9PEZI|nr:hypothetical protein B0H65DRAFT_437087 [Neurospora tetraspora]
MSGNTITIRDPSRTTPSPRSQPTTTPERNIFTNPAQTSEESSAEDDIDESPLPSSASIPSPSPSPAPAPAPVPSPSPSVLLAELPYGLLSPTPVSSVTASPTPPASRWVNFSPSPRAGSRSPFSSYTSISEGGSDDEGWPDDEEWLNAAAVLENADDDDEDDEDNDSDEEDDGTENSNSDDNESTGGQTLFCSRYDSWPDFDDDSPGGQTTNYISDDEDGSEWDIKSDALHEGPRYPGMNAFRLEGYTPAHDQPLDSGDQELEGIYITDDEDEESDADDEDEDEWAIENESELEAQPWGAGMRIIHYHPSMWM